MLYLSIILLLFLRKMEGGLPMLNCLLQHTLRSLCTCSVSSNWVYAVFWRILPRNYPPPKWDYEGGALDRAKGNKRNWILVWEDGFCNFDECERAGSGSIKGRFGPDIFFKMSHEVYNYGEGLVGKVAADSSHKWVYTDSPNENDPNFISSWNVSIDHQPRAWEIQFKSGIQTIAIISVREGIVQLGSFDKVLEDINLVISIQRKFCYLQSIPGIYAIQRPYLPIQQHPFTIKTNNSNMMIENEGTEAAVDDKFQLIGSKRLYCGEYDESPTKSANFDHNTPQHGLVGLPPIFPIPPLLPSMSCSLGALFSKITSAESSSYNAFGTLEGTLTNNNSNIRGTSQNVKVDGIVGLGDQLHVGYVKVETSCFVEEGQEENPTSLNPF